MINLQNVCYVRLGTRDLEGATQFATDILGLEVSEWGKATRLFKSDAREHTLCYVEGDPGFQVAGFEVANKEDLDQAASELEKLGHSVYVGTRAEGSRDGPFGWEEEQDLPSRHCRKSAQCGPAGDPNGLFAPI